MNGNSMLALLRVVFYLFAVVGVIGFAIGIFGDTGHPDYTMIGLGLGVALGSAFLGALCGAVDDIRYAIVERAQ